MASATALIGYDAARSGEVFAGLVANANACSLRAVTTWILV